MHRLSDLATMAQIYSGNTTEQQEEALKLLAVPEVIKTMDNLNIKGRAAMERTRDSRSLAATTKDMRDIAREAHRRGLNRQMKPAQFKLLDPKGTHILVPQFMHDKADGKPVEPHLRCHAHLKLLGKHKAVDQTIDVPMQFLRGYVDEAAAIEKGIAMKAMDGETDKTPEDYGGELVENYPLDDLVEKWKATEPERWKDDSSDAEGKA